MLTSLPLILLSIHYIGIKRSQYMPNAYNYISKRWRKPEEWRAEATEVSLGVSVEVSAPSDPVILDENEDFLLDYPLHLPCLYPPLWKGKEKLTLVLKGKVGFWAPNHINQHHKPLTSKYYSSFIWFDLSLVITCYYYLRKYYTCMRSSLSSQGIEL